MANSILGSNNQVPRQTLEQLEQFRVNYRGNAKQQVMAMLQSGRIGNQQFNQLMQAAQNLKQFVR